MSNFAELYKPELDELLIKLLCACFDVMPTEIGFPPGSGIGGKGHQEGEANSSQRKAVRPTATWLEGLLTDLSTRLPRRAARARVQAHRLRDRGPGVSEKVADSQTRRGAMTLNDDRAERGMPLYDFDEADEPFIVTGSGLVFLKGALAAQTAGAELKPPAAEPENLPADSGGIKPVTEVPVAPSPTPAPGTDTPHDGDPIAADEPVPEGYVRVQGHIRRKGSPAAVAEANKFVGFAMKRAGKTWRDFNFADIDDVAAARLNAAGRSGDLDLVKMLVADVGKAKARRVSRAAKNKLIKAHAPAIAEKVRAMLPSPSKLVEDWTATTVDKALTDNQQAARKFIEDQLDDSTDMYDDLDGEIEDFIRAGHKTAYQAAWISDDLDVDDAPETTALSALLDKLPDARDVLIGIGVGLVADALISDNPDANLTSVLDDHEFVDSFAGTELTGSLAAGTLDSAQKQEIYVVQIVASDGDCEFCQGYDGRILHLDETDGMPPLHRGCSCDIEPLD
jgi:hypothetical protein